MRKSFVAVGVALAVVLVFLPFAWSAEQTIKIGINAPITGDIPKVGEGTKYAAQMWLEDVRRPAASRWAARSIRWSW